MSSSEIESTCKCRMTIRRRQREGQDSLSIETESDYR